MSLCFCICFTRIVQMIIGTDTGAVATIIPDRIPDQKMQQPRYPASTEALTMGSTILAVRIIGYLVFLQSTKVTIPLQIPWLIPSRTKALQKAKNVLAVDECLNLVGTCLRNLRMMEEIFMCCDPRLQERKSADQSQVTARMNRQLNHTFLLVNFLVSSAFLKMGILLPSTSPSTFCANPSIPPFRRQMLSQPFSKNSLAYSIPNFSSKWYTTMILLSLFLCAYSSGMCLSRLILVPGQLSASRIWKSSQSSGSLMSSNRNSVSRFIGSWVVLTVMLVMLEGA